MAPTPPERLPNKRDKNKKIKALFLSSLMRTRSIKNPNPIKEKKNNIWRSPKIFLPNIISSLSYEKWYSVRKEQM